MIETCELAKDWRHVDRMLMDGRAVIVHSPRFFGRRSFVTRCLRQQRDPLQYVKLDAGRSAIGGRVNFAELQRIFLEQLGRPLEAEAQTRQQFTDMLSETVTELDGPLVVLVTGSDLGRVSELFELVSALDVVCDELERNHRQSRDGFAVAVLDDYALHYHEVWRTQQVSPWDHFRERVTHSLLTREELVETLQEMAARLHGAIDLDKPRKTQALARRLIDTTGGHPGLLRESIVDLQARGGNLGRNYWTQELPTRLRNSSLLESLRRSLSEDPAGLARLALTYSEPSFITNDLMSRELQTLKRLGLLHAVGATRAVVCQGVIVEMLEDLAKKASIAVGQDLAGLVEETASSSVEISGQDLVIVHLSDLHLGKRFPFRVPGLKTLENRNRKSLAGLLREDLQSLGYADRVDALVVSGDFTSTAASEEFLLAEKVTREILDSLNLSADRLVVCAGNHDLNWEPSEQAERHMETGVSRDSYKMFRRLLEKDEASEVDLLELERDGETCLRILALDSNYVEGPEAGGIGFVGSPALEEARRMLRKGAEPAGKVPTWIVVHHHVLPVNSVSAQQSLERKISVMGNAAELLSFAIKEGVEMILHGHEHQPSMSVVKRWPGRSPANGSSAFWPLITMGVGSLGAPQGDLGPFARNHYFIIARRAHDVVVISRALGPNGLAFEDHKTLVLPP